MDDSLYFTEQHLAVREMVRLFAREEVAPVAAQLDERAEFPSHNIKKMGELGLLGVRGPRTSAGGAGLHRLHDRDPWDGEGLRIARDHHLGPHHARNVAYRPLRDRGTETTVRSAARQVAV
jgi:alkylation response protein AidB-like acyl-CoA dehydrogenase